MLHLQENTDTLRESSPSGMVHGRVNCPKVPDSSKAYLDTLGAPLHACLQLLCICRQDPSTGRDQACAQERSKKVDLTRAQTARRVAKPIGISPGSKRLLRQWKTVKASPLPCPTPTHLVAATPQTFALHHLQHAHMLAQAKAGHVFAIMYILEWTLLPGMIGP